MLSRSAAGRWLRGRLSLRSVWGLFWLGLLAGGVAMSVWASIDDHFPADVAVGRWIQANDVGGQALIDFIRDVGSSVAALVTFLLVGAVLAVSGRRRSAAAVVGIFVGGLVLQALLKEIVDRPRSSVEFLEQRADFDSKSFPSGHVMSGVMVAGLMIYLSLRFGLRLWPLWLRAGVVVWVVGVAVLNPWVAITGGVHWPSDVLGGLVWGIVVVIPGLAVLRRTLRIDDDGGGT